MSSIFDYFNYYFYRSSNENSIENKVENIKSECNTSMKKIDKKFLISIDDLKSVNLQP
jgi:hypothetical protein